MEALEHIMYGRLALVIIHKEDKMALQKEIIKENGLKANYHRILCVHIDCGSKETRVGITMASYIDENYRLKEKSGEIENAVASTEDISIEMLLPTEGVTFSALYSKIKQLDKYKNSKDN